MKLKLCNSSNYRKGRTAKIKYIVIHYTGNDDDTAEGNANYFANNKDIGASAHYFVDENEVYQSVLDTDTAWHCGDVVYKHVECRNSNSIGIEICSHKDISGKYYLAVEAVTRAIELTKEKMNEYGIGVDCVLRHYDVTGKNCPAPMVEDPEQWENFKARLEGDNVVRYERLSDIPNEWGFRDIINILMEAKIISGDGSDPSGNEDIIDLSHDQVRSLIFEYRGGAFDKKLISMGMEPAVKV